MADYVDPIGSGLKPARIDMGVDYTGAGTLYAMGSGTIVNVANSGWPGGKFIGLKLDQGQYAGKYVYYAENIIPKVHVGQHVSAGTPIGQAVGTYPFVEVGWAAPPGTGQTMAAATGQQSKSGDPGAVTTAYGQSMSDLIKSLGGPAGIPQGGSVSGSVPADFASSVTPTALGSGCVPLIGVVYALFHTQKCGWYVSRRQLRNRRRKDEKRDEDGGTKTNAFAVRRRAWVETFWRATKF